jgi:thioredoxin 1
MDILPIAEHQFKQEVIDSDRLVIVDFWADWCTPCHALLPTLNKIAHTFAREVRIVKINVDDEQALAQVYSVRSIPTLLYFKNGKMVDSSVGAISEQVISNTINKNLAK